MTDFDVIIIGYGPTGKVLARQLLDKGHKVAVVERWPGVYPLPRAIGLDHEVRRILNALGYSDEVSRICRPLGNYTWYSANWKILIDLDQSQDSISGGPIGYTISQPDLERILERDMAGAAGLGRFTNHEALDVTEIADGVSVTIAPVDMETKQPDRTRVQVLTGRYVIGCDGANSLVRDAMDVDIHDHGFDEPWLVVDVRPNPGFSCDIPDSAQWCNPDRPTTIMPSGTEMRRWEFMLKPGETPEEFQQVDTAWGLLSPWMTPSDGQIVRLATYRFRSRLVRGWRKGRMILAGDAAHLMPPFMGQGLCAGIRDAWTLGWKLDRVLIGSASDRLLDSYEAERAPHVDAVIRISMALGRVICVQDPAAAAERDTKFLGGHAPEPPTFPPLTDGMIARDAGGALLGCAGHLMPHDMLERDGHTQRLDDLTGRHFVLISSAPVDNPRLDALDVRQVTLGPGGWRDVNGRLSAMLDETGMAAVLIRPDFYAFGGVPTIDGVPRLCSLLETSLTNGAHTPAN
jgi:2-polyprenyl-6-methoxyphenol hydroxylase-like FAD-dependent oxidoreductase